MPSVRLSSAESLLPTMAEFVTGAAKLVAGKHIENFAQQFEPEVRLYLLCTGSVL